MLNTRPNHAARYSLLGLLLLTGVLAATPLQANTLVRINTPLGGVTLELFDNVAPVTVSNFLNYVSSGRYNNTFVHRSEPGFVIQGGWLKFDEATQNISSIPVDGAIQNEFQLSNTRGTVAMAKVTGDPNSATSQWFVNLADNPFLDSDNGGFTVFGRIVDGGMSVIDAIAALPRGVLLQGLTPTPLINFTALPLKNANLVNLTMHVISKTGSAPNSYEAASGLLYTTIDTGASGIFSLAFSIHAVAPEVIIQALESSLRTVASPVANMATFDAATGRVTIPEFVIDGSVAFRNVVFEVSDAANLRFRLVSAQ